MDRTYNDLDKIIKKLEKEVINANEALVSISIAKESQEYLLKYWKNEIKKYPKLIMAEDKEKSEEEKKEEEDKENQ